MQITIEIEDNSENLWGVQFARQEANRNVKQRLANVELQNEQIAARNATLKPEFQQALIEVPVLHTDESFLQSRLDGCVEQMRQTMLQAAEQNLITFAKSLPPATLQAIIAQAGAPPLLKE